MDRVIDRRAPNRDDLHPDQTLLLKYLYSFRSTEGVVFELRRHSKRAYCPVGRMGSRLCRGLCISYFSYACPCIYGGLRAGKDAQVHCDVRMWLVLAKGTPAGAENED
jgi:hypothetical protein